MSISQLLLKIEGCGFQHLKGSYKEDAINYKSLSDKQQSELVPFAVRQLKNKFSTLQVGVQTLSSKVRSKNDERNCPFRHCPFLVRPSLAGFRPYSEIIGNGRILKIFSCNLVQHQKEAYTKILRLVGVCVGEFFTKNTLKLFLGQNSLKKDFFTKFFFHRKKREKFYGPAKNQFDLTTWWR